MGHDVGIDLGTATTIIHVRGKGIVLREPSIVAASVHTGKVLCVGTEAKNMLGKTPDKIRVVKPLADGVISDYEMTGELIKHFLRRVSYSGIFKPRVCICVPSGVTEVESRAVVDTALAAGARKVFLIEEPVAAALGAGLDITRPQGYIILDIGGGTSDVAVLSLSGIVCKTSLKLAGNQFSEAIVRYIRDKYNVLVGFNTAEKAKIEVGTVWRETPLVHYDIKGRNLMTGYPEKLTITNHELIDPLMAEANLIIDAVQTVLERTPPELVADLQRNGILMTGGGSMLNGLDKLVAQRLRLDAFLAQDPVECVARGVGRSFDFLDKLADGFVTHLRHYE